jgi:hypothetical protein
MGKEQQRRPCQPVLLYGALGLLGLIALAILTAGIGLLVYAITHGSGLMILQAVVIVLGTSVPLMFAVLVAESLKTRRDAIRAYDLKQLRAPHIAAWRASLLDPSLQPNGRDLVALDMDEIVAKDDFWDLGEHEVKRIRELGLQLYKDPREHGARWIGQINTADPAHSHWWYSEHPYKTGKWRVSAHEFLDAHGGTDNPPTRPGKKIVYLLSTMLFETRGPLYAGLALARAGVPQREDMWLRHFIQTFGHAEPKIIQHMPQQVRWDEVHQVLYHYDTWQAANDAVGMPQELSLRMVGLAALMECFEPEQLMREDMAPDYDVEDEE